MPSRSMNYMFFIYKHNVYKHTEPNFWWKFKQMLSIKPSLNLCRYLNFFFEFPQSTTRSLRDF